MDPGRRPLTAQRDPTRHDPTGLPWWFVGPLAVAPIAFLVVFHLWPFAELVRAAVGVDAVTDVFGRATTWEVLGFTVAQAVASTVATLLIGIPATWAISRFDFPGRTLLLGLLTAVFVLPTVVVAAAVLAVLPEPVERGIWAILTAHVVFNLAVVVRVVGGVWEQLPSGLDDAAATLGADAPRTFRYVTLPLLRPALTSAAGVVFLFTFTSFGVIRILGTTGTTTLEVEVWRRATRLGDIGGAAVLAVVQLVVLGVVVGVTAAVQRRASRRLVLERPVHRHRPGRTHRGWVVLSVTTVVVLVVTPLLALVERSLRVDGGYALTAWRSIDNERIRPGLQTGIDPLGALGRSVTTAVWATLIAVGVGAAAVVAITALRRTGRVLDVGAMLPLGTSAVTIGFGMLIAFDTPPFDWRSSGWLVPVGHALVAVPFVVRSVLGVARSVDPDLQAAAATLGAGPVRAWATAVLPALRRPLTASAGLAAAISLGEFGATSFLSRSGSDTLPIAIERLLGRTGSLFQAQAFALSTVLAATTIGIVLLVDRLGGTRGSRARRP